MRRFWKSLFCLLFFTMLFGEAVLDAAPVRLRSIWLNKTRYVDLAEASAQYAGKTAGGKTQTLVTQGKKRLIFYPEKRYSHLDGIRVNLLQPLRMQNGRPYLGELDYNTILMPALAPGKQFRHPVWKIVLDPGHGGRDQGAATPRLLEKNVTLNLSNRVAKILRTYGYKVELTRTQDRMMSLSERSAYANRAKASLFISLHVNSTSDGSVHGIETFCMTPAGGASSNGGGAVTRSYPGNANNQRNFLLAYHLQRSTLARAGATDRGVKFARFAVLRDVSCPAALIEVGFLSNRNEEANLRNPAYLDKLARGIAAGILNYHRSLAR